MFKVTLVLNRIVEVIGKVWKKDRQIQLGNFCMALILHVPLKNLNFGLCLCPFEKLVF